MENTTRLLQVKQCWLAFCFFMLPVFAVAQKSPFVFDMTYTGDVASNLHGGIRPGVAYLGYWVGGVKFDSEKAHWWKGGSFYLGLGNTHGGEPSADFVGDAHIVDNIEAGNHTFLHELWFRQEWRNGTFAIGMLDLNDDFASCDESSHFLHSVLGINSVISTNMAVPIFPLDGFGAQFGWNISDRFRWQACVFDGLINDFEDNPYNVEFPFHFGDGAFLCSELHYVPSDDGCVKMAGFYHTGNKKYGAYVLGNRRFDNVALFGQVAYSPNNDNQTWMQMNGGINIYNLLKHDDLDVLGLAFASNFMNTQQRHESFFELTYKYRFNDFLFVQPNFQYVINPSGTDRVLDNAVVFILRFELKL